MKHVQLYAWLLVFCVALGPAGANPAIVSCSGATLLADGSSVRLEGKVAVSCKTDFSQISRAFDAASRVGTVQNTALNEASGLAASRKNANVLWAHNDSGDSARVFAINTAGTHLGIYSLSGAGATDWEDMAIGPGPVAGNDYLYMGDIGDNNGGRASIRVYRVQEPVVSSTQPPVTVTLTGVQALTLVYEDGPRDAETLMIDPRTGDLYIVTKRESRGRVYRAAAAALVPATTITLHLVAQLNWSWATGGDISPQGDEIIIRGYGSASVWARPANTNLWDAFAGTEYSVPVASEPQGEAVAYDPQGNGYYTTSEYTNQPIYHYARQSSPGSSCFYVEEQSRCAGIRVAAPVSGFGSLARGCRVNVQGTMATTSDDERYVANPVVEILPDPSVLLDPLGSAHTHYGGGDLGTPPFGQYGPDDAVGLNSVGLLVRCWGRVSAAAPQENYVSLTDGSGVELRVDVTGLRNELAVGRFAAVTGVCSLRKSGSSHIRLIRPRSDGDVTLYAE